MSENNNQQGGSPAANRPRIPWSQLVIIALVAVVAGFIGHEIGKPATTVIVEPTPNTGLNQPQTPVTATPGNSQPAPASSSPSQNSNAPAGTVVRSGQLTLQGDGTAYDLDSAASDWTPSKGVPWNGIQNIEYQSDVANSGKAGFLYAQSPYTVALLPPNAPVAFSTCQGADYGGNGNTSDMSNYPIGSAIAPGRVFCVHTPAKNTAALKIVQGDSVQIVVSVTVWKGE